MLGVHKLDVTDDILTVEAVKRRTEVVVFGHKKQPPWKISGVLGNYSIMCGRKQLFFEKMQEDGLGYVLDQSYKDQYHLNVDPEEHGELVFYLEAPSEFTNTIWGFGHSVKSGHGFNPQIPKHHGFFCSDKNLNAEREFVQLTDLLPTVLAQLGVSAESYTFRGENIIPKNR